MQTWCVLSRHSDKINPLNNSFIPIFLANQAQFKFIFKANQTCFELTTLKHTGDLISTLAVQKLLLAEGKEQCRKKCVSM